MRAVLHQGRENETRLHSSEPDSANAEHTWPMRGVRSHSKSSRNITLEWLMSIDAYFYGPAGKIDEEEINVPRSLQEWSQTFQVDIVEVRKLSNICC